MCHFFIHSLFLQKHSQHAGWALLCIVLRRGTYSAVHIKRIRAFKVTTAWKKVYLWY